MKSLSDFQPYSTIYVDGMNLMSRSYYGMHDLSYQGRKTGMMYGMCRFVLDWRQRAPNTSLVVLWEGKNSWRKAKYPIYKYNRMGLKTPEESTEFFDCVDQVKYALPAMGVRQAWAETYEADDVVDVLARSNPKESNSLYSSGDWDWWGLADFGDILYQHSVVLTTETMGAMFEKKFGAKMIPVSKIWLFKALTGDPSDNVSGIPYFPKKIASEICRLDWVTDNIVENMLDNLDYALRGLHADTWADRLVDVAWLIDRNAELLRPSKIPLDKIAWIESAYCMDGFKDVLLKSGMDNMLYRLTGVK